MCLYSLSSTHADWLSQLCRLMCSPGMLHTLLVAVGVSGAGVALVSRLWPSLLGGLCLLGWTAAEVGKLVWHQFKGSPDTAIPQLGMQDSLSGRLLRTALSAISRALVAHCVSNQQCCLQEGEPGSSCNRLPRMRIASAMPPGAF